MEEITNLKQITFQYIKEYVTEKGETDIQWLLDTFDTEMPPDKNGKQRRITFIELRKAFAIKYMPELIPPPKEKRPTMFDEIEELRAQIKTKGSKKK